MPTVDGIDVCRRVPHLVPFLDCQVIILSAATEAGVHELAMEAGATAFLTKDLPRKEILRTVLDLAARRSSRVA
jgi:CheY-like chemotaxis protein